MHTPFQRVARIAVLAAAAVLVTGCAVTEEQLEEVRGIANNALSEARAAQGAANNALNRASEAAEAASRAQSTADQAAACCRDNTERINQMFEQAMRK
jgi:hypothetical protein